jgi:O-antigen/teichoic acid export membrane protein
MSIIKKLAGDTAIYGIPSIVGRFINFLLIFFFANYFTPELLSPQIEFYAYAAFFFVILPHGMETAFFNFSRNESKYKDVFATAITSVAIVAAAFLALMLLNKSHVADFVGYPKNISYVIWFGLIMTFDAIKSVPYALLRYLNKPKKFAFIKSVGIFLNVALNVFFIVYYPDLTGTEKNIEYVFISNLIASAVEFLLLLPDTLKHYGSPQKQLWKEMFSYAWPLIILGFAGIINETFDRVALRHLLPEEQAQYEIGVYGTFYRLSMIMTIFIQAFRYAAEPFFFSESKQADAKKSYAKVMNYFVLVCGFIFLGTALLKQEIAEFLIRKPEFHEHPDALTIVPILLLANLFLGVFFNLSIWYKLNHKTKLGALISVIGAIITVVLLFVYVPQFGFLAAAVTTLIVYFIMVVISYFMGRKYYPVPYELTKLIPLIVLAILLYFVSQQLELSINSNYLMKLMLLIVYSFVGYLLIIRRRKV